MSITRLSKSACPECMYVMDAATGVGHDRKPRSGDITVCWNCGACLSFSTDLILRSMTDDDWSHVHPETRDTVMRVQKQIKDRRK